MGQRSWDAKVKRDAVRRLERGESGPRLARELEVACSAIYRWRDAIAAGATLKKTKGFRIAGRVPSRAQAKAPSVLDPQAQRIWELEQREAELQRKIGQQQMDLDFLREALRRVEGLKPAQSSGAAASTSSSKSK